ncbi:MAG: L-seryl-tRNA(Sec) selenium transferase [Fuerstiella sp.]|nr:L-seryl-tRNA(Sec) selenium transferase [Fuerstiella sp.]
MSSPLRNLPAVNTVLSHPDVDKLHEQMSRAQIIQCVRTVLDDLRNQLRETPDSNPETTHAAVARRTIEAAERLKLRRLNPVINATGVILHTNLGRATLSDSAIARILQAAKATNVELDLDSGRRGRRGVYAEDLIRQLTGASDALIVNNCAAATMLALQGVAAGKEVIISRGQLVEIGGGFRLPDVFEAAGVILKEVGTSNRTRIDDYEKAIHDKTGAILRVHRSNFRVSGFVAEPSAAELVGLARRYNLPMIDDLGSGCLANLTSLNLDEPDVASSLASDADLVLFSGDKLLGGPQAGILLGKADWIARLRRHPMARATRVCKLTLAALEATLEDHLAGNAFDSVPVLSMLSMPAKEVQERCERAVDELSEAGLDLSVVPCQSEVGGGSMADQSISSFAVRIGGSHANELLRSLRTSEARILGRIENGAVLLDFRAIHPKDDSILVNELRRIIRKPWRTDR